MLPEITAIKTALDIVNNFKTLVEHSHGGRVSGDIAKKLNLDDILALQRHLHAAQESISTLREENDALSKTIRSLETKIADQESWADEKIRYELHDAGSSIMVYRLGKEHVSPTEPVHSLCPTCFSNSQKSILQVTNLGDAVYQLNCSKCGQLAAQMTPFRL